MSLATDKSGHLIASGIVMLLVTIFAISLITMRRLPAQHTSSCDYADDHWESSYDYFGII